MIGYWNYDTDFWWQILGYKLTYPRFDVDSVKETIESYRAEGIWPETSKYPPS
jgi:hypothetical protein